jgi:hypothetical protein
MAANRKNKPAVVRFGPALKALLLCLFIGGSGIGYVGQKNQLHVLGTHFKNCELRLDKVREEKKVLERVLDSLQSPAELDARVKQMSLGLVPPQPDQIIRLVERPPEAFRKSSNPLYVEQTIPSKDPR